MTFLSRICQPCQKATCARLGARLKKMQQFRKEAGMAASVYKDKPLPPGVREATDAEIESYGINRDFLEKLEDPKTKQLTDFRAKMYVDTETGQRYIAFRGTQSWQDWGQNIAQGAGLKTAYYTRAQRIASTVSGAPGGDQVKFVGHSLGGGLASAASRASGNAATTFNSAGLNPITIMRGDHWRTGSPIDAVHVKGELLTGIQRAVPLVPEASVSKDWPLDPREGFGRQQWERMKNLQVWDATKAAATRALNLHGMDEVIPAIDQDIDRTRQEMVDNRCPGS